MAGSTKSTSSTGSSPSELTTIEAIQKIARDNAFSDLNTERQLILFLKSWWSRTYNRPLKDPLLLSYTLEELLYEMFDRVERTKAYEEQLEQIDVKMEEDKDRADEDWAEKMEREEREADLRNAAKSSEPKSDPTKDPANVAWMEKQLQEAKALYGESFGEDIEDSFDG